jgi:hypothetical protein
MHIAILRLVSAFCKHNALLYPYIITQIGVQLADPLTYEAS